MQDQNDGELDRCPTDDGSSTASSTDEHSISRYVDEAIAEDPVWTALREAIDEDTYVAHNRADGSRFSSEIQARINDAVEELEQAAALRAAEVAHDTVRDDGSSFIDRTEHRLAGAKPESPDWEAADGGDA